MTSACGSINAATGNTCLLDAGHNGGQHGWMAHRDSEPEWWPVDGFDCITGHRGAPPAPTHSCPLFRTDWNHGDTVVGKLVRYERDPRTNLVKTGPDGAWHDYDLSFWTAHAERPWILEWLDEQATARFEAGQTVSINLLVEMLRHSGSRIESDPTVLPSLNRNDQARWARLLIARHPEWPVGGRRGDFIEVRSDQGKYGPEFYGTS